MSSFVCSTGFAPIQHFSLNMMDIVESMFDNVPFATGKLQMNVIWLLTVETILLMFIYSLLRYVRSLQYAERLPIGTEKVIRTVSSETVKGFYQKWYSLHHMAVVAVGDFPDTKV